MYKATCQRWQRDGFCSQRNCLLPQRCGNLKLGYPEALEVYKRIAGLPRVKHVFVSSGFRYDLLTQASDSRYLEEVCRNHISGQMKVAPEHTADKVLRVMNKSPLSTYERFLGRLREVNKKLSRKVYLVNYFISSHPGTRLKEARQLSAYLRRRRMCPEQIQDFIPLPMTLSGCMYYTGINPLSGEKVYVPRSPRERRLQRSLIQYRSHRHERFEG
jgi:uncharacterized radical SAM protein YgiQ